MRRKFQINDPVWATVEDETYHGRVVGFEDGRNLKIKAKEWMYEIHLYSSKDHVRVEESNLRRFEDPCPMSCTNDIVPQSSNT